jgi:hypothetical protein
MAIDGKNIQDVLQDAFFGTIEALVDAVGELDAVMGFEVGTRADSGS